MLLLPTLFSVTLALCLSDDVHPPLTPGTRLRVCESADRTPYYLHIPPDFDTNWPTPLVIVLSEESEALKKTSWDVQADRCGFVALTFERMASVTPEVLDHVLADVRRQVTLDPARLFLALESNHLPDHFPVEHFAAISLRGEEKDAIPMPSGTVLEMRSGKRDTQAVWTFFDRHPRPSEMTHPMMLTVICSGLRNDNGQVLVSLFDRSEGFPDSANPFRTVTVTPTGKTATAHFADLPPGDYACVFVHDENSNSKLDTTFGIPKEGFGTSNNPKVRFGPPRYSDARFYLAGDTPERRIRLRATYF